MGLIWGRQDRGGPHVGPMNFAIWEIIYCFLFRLNAEDFHNMFYWFKIMGWGKKLSECCMYLKTFVWHAYSRIVLSKLRYVRVLIIPELLLLIFTIKRFTLTNSHLCSGILRWQDIWGFLTNRELYKTTLVFGHGYASAFLQISVM